MTNYFFTLGGLMILKIILFISIFLITKQIIIKILTQNLINKIENETKK